MKKNEFASHKEDLLALLVFRNVKKTHADQSILRFFTLSKRKRLTNLQK